MGRPDLLTVSRILTMSLEKPIPAEVTIDGYPVRIWYRGIKSFCSNCKVICHKAADCDFKGKCMRCGEAGHWARNCPSRRNGNAWGPTLPGAGVVPLAADFPPISTGNAASPPGNAPIPSNTVDSDPVALNVDPVVDLSMSEMVITVPGEVINESISKQSEASELNSNSGQNTSQSINDSNSAVVNSTSGQSTNSLINENSCNSGQSSRQVVNEISSNSGQNTRQIVNDYNSNSGQSTSQVINVSNCPVVGDIEDDMTEFTSQDSTPLQGSESLFISEFSSPLSRSVSFDNFETVTRKRPGFTWTKWNGALASRIDLAGVPSLWITSVNSCSVVPCPFYDHCGVLTSVSVPDIVPPGPGLWKLNRAILKESEYVQL
ncbi:Branchpoint-bridging protein [Stylophora pistillata]|uniref:Branchpoint-bridging protein n=1 Tax=Stylophora pistillata TaxID=50429 RepID=A0A2B4R5B2_STYPI|nr:Branchpoint-bridging protein [Stylophora pistillata]